jgi:DNA (cytosine-5)-methyltransferase 1
MTKFKEWNIGSIDLLVGGTPCQSFSVAGLRKGLDDPRGNLMLTYLAIADQHRPRWLVWENVPGVLSSNGGKDFGVFLGALGELGYGFAYRILDAQYFGVAQRRRRVFVVGYLGDWRAAAAVLFERHSLSGDSAPSREKRKEAASGAGDGAAISSHWDGDYPHPTLNQSAKGSGGVGFSNQEIFSQRGAYLAAQPIPLGYSIREDAKANTFSATELNVSTALKALQPGVQSHHAQTFVAQPIPFDTTQITSKANYSKPESGDPCHPLAAGAHPPAIAQPISFSGQMSEPQTDVGMTQTLQVKNPMAVAYGTDLYNGAITGDVAVPMTNRADGTGTGPTVMQAMEVRRLTPVECERLQGFPDSYTNIKDKCPDGPRYKALGNSMAVPVMAWIGKRIQEVENLQCKPNK